MVPTIWCGDLALEKKGIRSEWNFSRKSTQEGQQVVISGNFSGLQGLIRACLGAYNPGRQLQEND